MKYCTKLRKEQSDFEQWLPLVGSYCGNAKIEKVLENREKEVLNRFVNISDVIRSMIETINEKIPDPRKWSRRLKATLFIKKFNEAVS